MPKSEFATFDEALEAYGVVLAWPGEEAAEQAAAARANLEHAWKVREDARQYLRRAVCDEQTAEGHYARKRTDENYRCWIEAIAARQAARTILGEEAD